MRLLEIKTHREKYTSKTEILRKTGHLEKVKKVHEDCFLSPVLITIKNDKSVKRALDYWKPNYICTKRRPHMPNIEELIHQTSTELIQDGTGQLFSSKVDMDYAYE